MRGIGASRGSSITRGNAGRANKWQMGGRGSSLSRGGSTLRGRKDSRGRWHDKMRHNNQPVHMKRTS
jgi:hypothetical protein